MYAADAASVNPNGIRTFLINGSSAFFFNEKPVFSNCLKSLTRNRTDQTIIIIIIMSKYFYSIKVSVLYQYIQVKKLLPIFVLRKTLK